MISILFFDWKQRHQALIIIIIIIQADSYIIYNFLSSRIYFQQMKPSKMLIVIQVVFMRRSKLWMLIMWKTYFLKKVSKSQAILFTLV